MQNYNSDKYKDNLRVNNIIYGNSEIRKFINLYGTPIDTIKKNSESQGNFSNNTTDQNLYTTYTETYNYTQAFSRSF